MKLYYERTFLKDLKKLNESWVKGRINHLLDEMKVAEDLSAITDVKKLKGHSSAYRIRIGDYRIGLYFENGCIILTRCLHRKNIYKKFP